MKRLFRVYLYALILVVLLIVLPVTAFATGGDESSGAVEDMWTVANRIIVDVYNQIAAISTVLAGLMSAVAVIGVKMTSNDRKTEQSLDWLKRIWFAWVVINGIGAFIAYVRPMLAGLNTIS
jgi:hypothetical protein